MLHSIVPTSIDDALLFIFLPLVTYLLKVFFKPNRIELKILANVITALLVIMCRVIRDHHDDIKPHIGKAQEEFEALKTKLKKARIDVG